MCGEEYTPVNRSRKNNSRFCSKKCYGRWLSENIKGSGNNKWRETHHLPDREEWVCDNCGKIIQLTPSDIKAQKHHFCSNSCFHNWSSKNIVGDKHSQWRGGQVNVICEQCNKEFFIYPSRKKHSRYFCTMKCYNKWRSENFRGSGNPMNIPEVRQKHKSIMAEKMSGDNNPTKRPEVRERMRIANVGKQAGERNPMWSGGPKKCICEQCGEEFEVTPSQRGRFCSQLCHSKWMIERGIMAGNNNPSKQFDVIRKRSGSTHYNWQGGITNLPYCDKWTEDLRVRTRAFQGNVCILCGKTKEEEGKQLQCHHVNFDKMMCCNDGYPMIATLCGSCHGRTVRKGDTEEWRSIFESIITDRWGGKSFYSAEEWYDMLNRGDDNIEDYTIYPSKALNQLRRLLKVT